MLDWLIIGGGVHGTHLSHVLMNGCGVPGERLVVLDPYDEPMKRWRHCTTNTGMTHLRSPVVHHLGLEAMELLEFSRASPGRKVADFRPPYDRPGLELFEAHSVHVCDAGGLCNVRRKGWARYLQRAASEGFVVETDRGALKARRVVLAMGSGENTAWPSWAADLREEGALVWHVFDDDFSLESLAEVGDVIIVGLGISAAQLTTRLAAHRSLPITVVGRHEIRVHQFDSEPCWLGPKCQTPFQRLEQYEVRRRAIDKARHNGSMPQDVATNFRRLIHRGRVTVKTGAVTGGALGEDGRIELVLEGGDRVRGAALVLATGFESPRPDHGWLADAIDELGLKCAACGFPIVDEALQWKKNLFVSGPLAELELGAAARNIAGARMAGRRLARLAVA